MADEALNGSPSGPLFLGIDAGGLFGWAFLVFCQVMKAGVRPCFVDRMSF